jgi:hypothetical protein
MARRKNTHSITTLIDPPIKRKRGRPPKNPSLNPAVVKLRRGRPPKNFSSSPPPVAAPEAIKKRGRKPKLKLAPLAKKKEAVEVKTPEEKIIESHCFYPAAKWIENNIDSMEEAYIRKTAKKHGLTTLQNIIDHMLGYFSIKNSELGKAIRMSKKHTQ